MICGQPITISTRTSLMPDIASPPPAPPAGASPPPEATGAPLTPVQEAVLRSAEARGQNPEVVANETSALLALLDSHTTREWLQHFDEQAGLHRLSSMQLYGRLRDELEAAEVVHNFDVDGRSGRVQGFNEKPYCGEDLLVEFGPQMEWFYNSYELWLHGLTNQPDYRFTNDVETVMGFPDFNDFPPPSRQAADRLVWGALNIHRKSTGNPVCGTISAVFAKKRIGPNAIVSPIDSGIMHQIGWDLDGHGTVWHGVANMELMARWEEPTVPSLARSTTYTHLIPTHVRAFAGSRFIAGDGYASYNLARLLLRLLMRRTYRAPFYEEGSRPPVELNFMEHRFGYLEYNPVMRVGFPNGVLMLVGVVNSLIGSNKAESLREWCIAQGWALAWTYDPYPRSGPPCVDPESRLCFEHHAVLTDYDASNVRLLDPYVLRSVPHGHNLTADTSGGAFGNATRAFDRFYSDSRRNGTVPSGEQWAALLREQDMAQLAIEPVYARACSDERCVGVRVVDATCVCP